MKKIDFEDIRVGDKIKVVDHYESGDSAERAFTVKRIQYGALYSANSTFGVNSGAPYGASRYWYLVDRPKPTFKVGDTITGEQVADLPDGAVFDLNECGAALRYKIGGEVYAARGSVIPLAIYKEDDYRNIKIVFLPEA